MVLHWESESKPRSPSCDQLFSLTVAGFWDKVDRKKQQLAIQAFSPVDWDFGLPLTPKFLRFRAWNLYGLLSDPQATQFSSQSLEELPGQARDLETNI